MPPVRSTSGPMPLPTASPCSLARDATTGVICLGTLEGLPLLTFTAPGPPGSMTGPAAPSPEYLAHLVIGLRETFDLDDPAIGDYLGCASGVTAHLVRAALAT